MATLTIIPYAPKPQKHHIQNRPSKPVIQQTSPLDKNPRIDPSDVSITVPPTLIGAVVNNWCQKGGGNSEVAAQDVQPYGDNLVGARGMSIGGSTASQARRLRLTAVQRAIITLLG